MAYRRTSEDSRNTFYGYRARNRRPGGDPLGTGDEEAGHLNPRHSQSGFGWARERDVGDSRSQSAAPRSGGRYDRTGEEGYARGLEQFEPGRDHDDRRRPSAWELDEGGVQFGAPMRREPLGPHRGRGPRGYQRSDERVREDVCDALTEAHDVDASGIDVRVEAGTVTLTGTVDDRLAKRRSEDIAAEVGGVHDVQNQLRVQSAATSRS